MKQEIEQFQTFGRTMLAAILMGAGMVVVGCNPPAEDSGAERQQGLAQLTADAAGAASDAGETMAEGPAQESGTSSDAGSEPEGSDSDAPSASAGQDSDGDSSSIAVSGQPSQAAAATPAAPGSGAVGQAGAGDTGAAGGSSGQMSAAAIQTQAAQMQVPIEAVVPLLTEAAAQGGAVQPSNPLGATEGDAALRATQEAINEASQIAKVDSLVESMPPLATFTPAPGASELPGTLLYVRNGQFYTAQADGSASSQPLALENGTMPSVWSPPDDPGRAWVSPDGQHVGFLAGTDAEVWVMDIDGQNNRRVFPNVLPNEVHEVTAGGDAQQVKLLPGRDYTLVYGAGGSDPFGVLIDNNEYHISGQGRIRVVHAAAARQGANLLFNVDGEPLGGGRVRPGRGTSEEIFPAGAIDLEVQAPDGETLATFTNRPIDSKEVSTIFVYGQDQLQLLEVPSEVGTRPASGQSRLRIFNASGSPIDLEVDGQGTPVRGLGPGEISPYIGVPGVLSHDAREDFEISIYGLRPGENPIVWTPQSDRFAFVAGPTGVIDLFVTTLDGEVSQLTDDPRREMNPRWSPDGAGLAWISIDEAVGDYDLRVLPPGGGTPRSVDLGPIRRAAGADQTTDVRFPTGIEWVTERQLGFIPSVDRSSQGIWTYDVAADRLTQRTAASVAEASYSDVARAWVYDDGDVGRITVLPLEGSPRVIVDQGGFAPEWAPDGRTVTYSQGAPTNSEGWQLRAVAADGGNDRALSPRWPIMQESPPVPGPDAKRFWIDDDTMVFTRVGRDYGKKDRAGMVGNVEAGDDIENFYGTGLDGASVTQMSDLTSVFYLNDLKPHPQQGVLAFVAFAYDSRSQQLLTMDEAGGKPVKIDGPVRWFAWLD